MTTGGGVLVASLRVATSALAQSLLGFHASVPVPTSAYDIWSVGVVLLEMVLGRRDVFAPSARVHAILARRLAGQPPEVLQRAAFLTALADYCIYSPEHSVWLDNDETAFSWRDAPLVLTHTDGIGLQPVTCGLQAFNATLVRHDPLRLGIRDPWGLRLLWRLLQWDPRRRISAHEALQHVRSMCGAPVVLGVRRIAACESR